MSKVTPNKPLFIMMYGYPGAGKTHFARQLSDVIHAAHIDGDRIRGELFTEPRYDKEEDEVVNHLMLYMAEEFLSAGVSVIFDTNVLRLAQRRELRNIARKAKVQQLLIWLQIDAESAFARLERRDKRRADDKYAVAYSRGSFDSYIGTMQNPRDEEYIVISGKHTFNTQRSAVIKKLYELGLVAVNNASTGVVKPGLVNLIPNRLGGRVDNTRRNILIR